MKKFTHQDAFALRHSLVMKIPELENTPLDFFYAPGGARSEECAIVTFIGKTGMVAVTGEWENWPSDEVIGKIRLLML